MIDFLNENIDEILKQTAEHLWLSGISITLSGMVGISIGILLTRHRRLAAPVIGFTGVLQTIPSLAMLGFFIPLLGIGKTPAVLALFLYALLPIVRNTYTGLTTVDPHVKESAVAMGMTRWQLLRQIEFPIALPVIFAGVRTATVINVGVATLCALIGAGGLGEFIFRGITLNLMPMILAGAIPASLLAIGLDFSLSLVEKNVKRRFWPFLGVLTAVILYPAVTKMNAGNSDAKAEIIAGFNSEFMNREDGWPGLKQTYGLKLPAVELEIALMYEALKNDEVDLIAGFTTDGRIQAYDLAVLEDDKSYFPPYFAVPLLNRESLGKFPLIEGPLLKLEGTIPAKLMAYLNLQVDSHRLTVEQAADSLLKFCIGKTTNRPKIRNSGKNGGKLVIGSKAFTENYILASFFARYIESTTPYHTDLKLGFGGTKLLFDALREGAVDLYPEYTGTAWLVFAKPEKPLFDSLKLNPEAVYLSTRQSLNDLYGVTMFPSLGFNNTTALMMKRVKAIELNIHTISDLKNYLRQLED